MTTLREKLINPLKSRKVQTAIATLVVAYAAQWGFELSEEQILPIIGLGGLIVLGISIEDHGTKSAGGKLSITPLPLQELTAEPIGPAVGAAVAAAVKPMLSHADDARRLMAAALVEIRKANTQHAGSASNSNGTAASVVVKPGANGVPPKPTAPDGP